MKLKTPACKNDAEAHLSPWLRAKQILVAIGACGLLASYGCSGGPAAVALPDFDPAGAADKAMETYDTNGDGFIAGDELDQAPGLKAAIKTLDTDGDGKISASEIEQRINTWLQMSIGMMTFSCRVTMNGRPLEGATVQFDPEEFLGGAIQPAVGTTALGGVATPKVPKEKRPTPDTPPGVQAGIYKVRISKKVNGKELVPAKYNTQTILGQEVSKDDWAITNKRVQFNLKSK